MPSKRIYGRSLTTKPGLQRMQHRLTQAINGQRPAWFLEAATAANLAEEFQSGLRRPRQQPTYLISSRHRTELFCLCAFSHMELEWHAQPEHWLSHAQAQLMNAGVQPYLIGLGDQPLRTMSDFP